MVLIGTPIIPGTRAIILGTVTTGLTTPTTTGVGAGDLLTTILGTIVDLICGAGATTGVIPGPIVLMDIGADGAPAGGLDLITTITTWATIRLATVQVATMDAEAWQVIAMVVAVWMLQVVIAMVSALAEVTATVPLSVILQVAAAMQPVVAVATSVLAVQAAPMA